MPSTLGGTMNRGPEDRQASEDSTSHNRIPRQFATFAVILLVSLIAFRNLISSLARLSLHDERYSQILLIPAITAGLIYWDRDNIFKRGTWCRACGFLLLLLGAIEGFFVGTNSEPGMPTSTLFLSVLLLVALWATAFALCFGIATLRRAAFPWCFLFLVAPLPRQVLDAVVAALQAGSAEVSFVLFKAVGMPVLRDGLLFALPGVSIEIAKECSGIRSSMSLFLVSVLVSHLFLRLNWTRFVLCVLTIPIVIFKNALRIVGLSWLGVNVTSEFFHGTLHHQYGGLSVSLVSLLLQALVFAALWKAEHSRRALTCSSNGTKTID